MERDTQVLCIIFKKIADSYDYLLLQRIPDKGGFWQPPSGGVEKGEELLDAVYREVNEETGITKDDIIRVIPDVHSFIMDKHYITNEPITPITEHVFGVEVKPGTKVDITKNDPVEHNDFMWSSYSEALEFMKWDNNKDSVKKLKKLL